MTDAAAIWPAKQPCDKPDALQAALACILQPYLRQGRTPSVGRGHITLENTMLNVRTGATLLALALAVAATPALARQHARHPGHEARAQALDPDEGVVSPGRESALRECSALANKFVQKDWGWMQGQQERACMVEHGQME
jgi:hypothetical protein